MRVIVASRNPVKIAAVREAFERCLPDLPWKFEGITAVSGVSDQPVGDEETRTGARNRAKDARRLQPDADYWVGLEGGIDKIDDCLFAFAWMVVIGPEGRVGQSRSVSLPLPPPIQRLVDSGMELGEANDRVFATANSKQAGGAFGLLTDGRFTREGIYTQTVMIALVPLLHPLFRNAE